MLACSSSMSSFSFANVCRESRKHNNILLSSAKFTLDRIQDVTLDFSIPLFNDSMLPVTSKYKVLPSSLIPSATVKSNV